MNFRDSGRVTRGGSWYNGTRYAHGVQCGYWCPSSRIDRIGFRLVDAL